MFSSICSPRSEFLRQIKRDVLNLTNKKLHAKVYGSIALCDISHNIAIFFQKYFQSVYLYENHISMSLTFGIRSFIKFQ